MNSLRVGTYQNPQRTPHEDGGLIKLRGTSGVIVTNQWKCFSSNSEGHGARIENGTYTGVIGMVIKEEADVTFWPNTLNDVPEQLSVSPAIAYQSGSILSFPVIKPYAKQMLKCSDIFEQDVLYFLLTANIVLGITFALISFVKGFTLKYIQNQFEVGRCFVNQANLDSMKNIFSSLIILTLGGSFLFLQIFESGVGADSATVDYSDIVNSIQDIYRLKHKRVFMVKNQPMTMFLKYHKDPIYKQVYQRGLMNEKTVDLSLFEKPMTKDDVFLAYRDFGYYLANTYCTRLNRDYWMGNSWDDSILLVMYTAKNISKTWKSIIDQRSKMIIEFGIMQYAYAGNLRAFGALTESSESCSRSTLEDLTNDDAIDELDLNRCFSVFAFFLVLLSLSGFIFILELMMTLVVLNRSR